LLLSLEVFEDVIQQWCSSIPVIFQMKGIMAEYISLFKILKRKKPKPLKPQNIVGRSGIIIADTVKHVIIGL